MSDGSVSHRHWTPYGEFEAIFVRPMGYEVWFQTDQMERPRKIAAGIYKMALFAEAIRDGDYAKDGIPKGLVYLPADVKAWQPKKTG